MTRFPAHGTASVQPRAVARLARAMLAHPLEALPEPRHYRGQGSYVRAVTVGAGTVLAGHKHRTPHVFAVLKGWMYLAETGRPPRRVEAGDMWESPAGTQRVAWAPEVDCVCSATHGVDDALPLEDLQPLLVEPFNVEQLLELDLTGLPPLLTAQAGGAQ